MLNNICIDRCLCFQKKFTLLKEVARIHEIKDLGALQEKVEFGKSCQLCHPYVRKMLENGQTVFHQILKH